MNISREELGSVKSQVLGSHLYRVYQKRKNTGTNANEVESQVFEEISPFAPNGTSAKPHHSAGRVRSMYKRPPQLALDLP